MQKLFLTFFYSGKIPFAPGTMGSIAALIPAFFVLKFLSISTLFLLSILIFVVSIKIIDNYEKITAKHDSSEIVIDEVAGVFLACSVAASAGNNLLNFILAFVFFRLFDITKPSIIGRVDRNVKGGLGVMLDDMLAGLFAGLLSAIVYGALLKLEIDISSLAFEF